MLKSYDVLVEIIIHVIRMMIKEFENENIDLSHDVCHLCCMYVSNVYKALIHFSVVRTAC